MLPSLFSALLLQVPDLVPAWAVDILKVVVMPFVLLWIGRRLGRGDKHKEKLAAAEAERDAAVKALKVQAEENKAQHTNFQLELEKQADALKKLALDVNQNAKSELENKTKIDATKDALTRIEGQLTQMLTTLLQRP
ncbi:hypothetical protein GCM10023185_30970 [Hymenobacter saemangeumensis]|uniref:Uncharacterized protein n=1 Tax=Hymenobacter saemangeumensis TaxID=1084522 RepID=A0ABP8ILX9_9BACT